MDATSSPRKGPAESVEKTIDVRAPALSARTAPSSSAASCFFVGRDAGLSKKM
jgi:hypothetical protein